MTKGDLNLNLAPLVNDGKVDKAEVDSMNDLWLQSAAESAKEEKARRKANRGVFHLASEICAIDLRERLKTRSTRAQAEAQLRAADQRLRASANELDAVRWLAEEASSSAQIISSLIGKPTQEARCCPHCNGQQKINVLLAEDAAELAEDVGCLVEHMSDELESLDKVLEHLAEVFYKIRKLEQIETHGVRAKVSDEDTDDSSGTLDNLMTKLGLSRMGLFMAKTAKQQQDTNGPTRHPSGTTPREGKQSGDSGAERVVSTHAAVREQSARGLPAAAPTTITSNTTNTTKAASKALLSPAVTAMLAPLLVVLAPVFFMLLSLVKLGADILMALGWYVWRNLHDLVGTTPLELSAPRHFQRKARGLSLSVSLDNVRAADTEAVQTVHGSAPLPRRLQQRRRSESNQVYVRTHNGDFAHLPGASLVKHGPAAAGPISRPRHTDSGGVYPADATHGSRFQLRSGSPGGAATAHQYHQQPQPQHYAHYRQANPFDMAAGGSRWEDGGHTQQHREQQEDHHHYHYPIEQYSQQPPGGGSPQQQQPQQYTHHPATSHVAPPPRGEGPRAGGGGHLGARGAATQHPLVHSLHNTEQHTMSEAQNGVRLLRRRSQVLHEPRVLPQRLLPMGMPPSTTAPSNADPAAVATHQRQSRGPDQFSKHQRV